MPSDFQAAQEWDAGDMGCGELVMLLLQRIKSMSAGEVIRIRATDPGAKEDLPAWCSMTGHRLIEANHPDYWIKKKE